MKKFLCILLTVALMTTMTGAFALNYFGSQNNAATFETLEETRVSSPAAVANLETERVGLVKQYKSHPVLDGYPENTTYVYRSANLFGGRAAARLNTNVLVFSDQHFTSKDEALAYLKTLGIIDIIDEAVGSVVLVTPSNPEEGFGAADQKDYYALQTAMLAQKASETKGDQTTYYSDAEYFGGFGYEYLIGIDGGATFINNYVATTFDYISRIAGMLLMGGDMNAIRKIATFVPVYLVNAKDDVKAKYEAINATDSYTLLQGDKEIYYCQASPLQKVMVPVNGKLSAADYVKDAYYNLFIKAMRIPVTLQGQYTASTPYQGYDFDQAPYSLCERNAVINGKTENGITLTRHTEERFSQFKSADGEYLQTWFEYLPEEVLNNTAAKGTVPLVLGIHGGGDDPRLYVDEIGLLNLAGKERFAIVAPEHQYLWGAGEAEGSKTFGAVLYDALPALVHYMLDTYPALDASRVYATGYSMGGFGTLTALCGEPSLFAAGVMQAASYSFMDPKGDAEKFKDTEIPIMFCTSTFDMPFYFDRDAGHIAASYEEQINAFLGYDKMKTIDKFDYSAYDISGFAADRMDICTLNHEYRNKTWYLNNADGIPMVALNCTEGLVHALYPAYSQVIWNYVKHFSRDQATHKIVYNANVD